MIILSCSSCLIEEAWENLRGWGHRRLCSGLNARHEVQLLPMFAEWVRDMSPDRLAKVVAFSHR